MSNRQKHVERNLRRIPYAYVGEQEHKEIHVYEYNARLGISQLNKKGLT
jgi:hypothetical protein